MNENELLKQEEIIKKIVNDLGNSNWDTYYESTREKDRNISIFSAIIPLKHIKKSLDNSSWDFNFGQGNPGFITSYINNVEKIEYFRNTSFIKAEPIIICRSFEGIKNKYLEISEEFRLFHNLYYLKEKNWYIKIINYDEEKDVVKIFDDKVEIKNSYIKKYIAAKQMALAFFFVYNFEYLGMLDKNKIDNLNFELKDKVNLIRISRFAGNYDSSNKSFVRIYGKKIISCESTEKCNIYPFVNKREYEKFIIGEDLDGNQITYSSDPDKLSDNNQKVTNKPSYLMPIYFKKEVLAKYYNRQSIYKIEDSYLNCGSLWSNNHQKYVCVFLGDIGTYLPYEEQLYWRSFNVVPSERGISETYFRRSFLGDWIDPESKDLLFKSIYTEFTKSWNEKFGWNIFLPLKENDKYLFDALHIPLTNEQSEFDAQVMALAKILVDSINKCKLQEVTKEKLEKDKDTSINYLEIFLKENNVSEFTDFIKFLRGLYNLRSSGSGHRKGEKYKQAMTKLGFEKMQLSEAFNELCKGSIYIIKYLEDNFLK